MAEDKSAQRALIIDGTSGISGDMTVAALLDLGASQERLMQALMTLPVHGFRAHVSRVAKSGLSACDFDVMLDDEHQNHDHDMAWLFGEKGAGDEHCHEHGHERHHHHEDGAEHEGHCHDDHEHCYEEHDHEGHAHHHSHRSLADVQAIINASGLTDHAKELALAVFEKLAEAEAKAHGATPQTVMLHEVGAVDSIVDICAVATCLDDLGVSQVVVPSLSEGHGTIRCAHGMMPIPVPAVANLCEAAGIELVPAPVHGELVTPTGAAIVAALRTSAQMPASYRILATGYGAGKRAYQNTAGVLRMTLAEVKGQALLADANADAGEPADDDPEAEHPVTKLECDLDDCTGEALGRTIELLMAAGARDAHAVPVVMKKGRPGYQLEVICDASNEAQLRDLIFENTTTIGIRSMTMLRHPLRRKPGEVQTPFGTVATKRVVLPDGSVRSYPEYGSVVEACERTGASFQDVFRAVEAAGTQADAGVGTRDAAADGEKTA